MNQVDAGDRGGRGRIVSDSNRIAHQLHTANNRVYDRDARQHQPFSGLWQIPSLEDMAGHWVDLTIPPSPHVNASAIDLPIVSNFHGSVGSGPGGEWSGHSSGGTHQVGWTPKVIRVYVFRHKLETIVTLSLRFKIYLSSTWIHSDQNRTSNTTICVPTPGWCTPRRPLRNQLSRDPAICWMWQLGRTRYSQWLRTAPGQRCTTQRNGSEVCVCPHAATAMHVCLESVVNLYGFGSCAISPRYTELAP